MNFEYQTAPISPLDEQAMEEARRRNDALSKPLGSLGELETLAIHVAGITGKTANFLDKQAVIVMAADNGIYDEGISPVPQQVTVWQTRAIADQKSGIGVMTAIRGMELTVVDIGIKGAKIPGVIDARLMDGTGNIAKGPAMSLSICQRAIETGFQQALSHSRRGVNLIGTGEMGICNTSTSAALLSALTGAEAKETVGHGVGLTDELFQKKLDSIESALSVNAPFADATDALAKVGGLDIAALAGVFIGCAQARVPVVIDGFISIVAALAAVSIRPEVKPYLIASHKSREKGYIIAAEALGVRPVLDLNMRLGEGTGTPLMMDILRTACALQRDMITLDAVGLAQESLVDIREG